MDANAYPVMFLISEKDEHARLKAILLHPFPFNGKVKVCIGWR